MPRVVVLGPQRFRPGVAAALQSLECDGPVAVVTAGWQEREHEVDELARHVDREVINLEVYRRAERCLAEDPELAAGLRERQDALQRLQELYRLRLAHALASVRELMDRPGRDPFVLGHQRSAIGAVRALDRQHVARVRKQHAEFERRWDPVRRSAVARQREELAGLLERASALAIAGGHVAVLLNRLRLFGLARLNGERPIVAWSAGAMVLSERVVLFHDSPPQGPGNAEVLEPGLNVCPRIVPLPHAGQRLRLADPVRVTLFARRFSPAVCVRLDAGSRVDWDGQRWTPRDKTQRLRRTGAVEPAGPF